MVYTFAIKRVLGKGRDSVVYAAFSETFQRDVCLKCEPYGDAIQLQNEYCKLATLSGLPGVPRVLLYGYDGANYVLVTDVLGISLLLSCFHC